jgi:PKHD-type hydroxylase
MTITIQEKFEQNKFVVLYNVISKDECQKFVDYMFSLYNEGKLIKDGYCPLSDSIYNDSLCVSYLEKLTATIEHSIGKKLLPTYTYSRIYREGEILEPHTDRDACEISATITMGYEAESPWEICFDEDKNISIELQIGDIIIYKGRDISHWRPVLKGKWQVQLLMHWVDADGEFTENHLDKKQKEIVLKKMTSTNQKPFYEYLKNNKSVDQSKNRNENNVSWGILIPTKDQYFPFYYCIDKNNHPEYKFSKDECAKIISIKENTDPISGNIQDQGGDFKINKEIRSVRIYPVEYNDENKWIFSKIINLVAAANENFFDFDLSGIQHTLQLVEYSSDEEIKGHYNWHTDIGVSDYVTRKLSITIQLSDPDTYTDGDLVIKNSLLEHYANREQGSVHLFPSFTLHKVTPVTAGVRYSLVIWVHGSQRFR